MAISGRGAHGERREDRQLRVRLVLVGRCALDRHAGAPRAPRCPPRRANPRRRPSDRCASPSGPAWRAPPSAAMTQAPTRPARPGGIDGGARTDIPSARTITCIRRMLRPDLRERRPDVDSGRARPHRPPGRPPRPRRRRAQGRDPRRRRVRRVDPHGRRRPPRPSARDLGQIVKSLVFVAPRDDGARSPSCASSPAGTGSMSRGSPPSPASRTSGGRRRARPTS